ncbi:MAG: radical SAM protein [Aureispira sp.]|nr:radical SAM protein [Aureispira sp.]
MKKILSSPKLQRKLYELKVAKDLMSAAADPYRPLLAQIVITRRCNLSCGYCFEYDKVSKPVALDILKARIDELKRLRVVFVTLNGGEPLLHPERVELVRYIRELGMTPMINSNGFALKPKLIKELNEAGLFGIQISCDGLTQNEVSEKTMDRLLPKLEMLAKYAEFRVRVNTVLGSCPPKEAIEVAKIVTDLGFDAQCSLVRDEHGSAMILDEATQEAYMAIRAMQGRLPTFLNDNFQLPLVRGEEIKWKCRSGARYFHVDENGIVHLCQPRAGFPGKPIEEYQVEDIKSCFHMHKPCSKRCPHAYAHIGSRMDGFRHQNIS